MPAAHTQPSLVPGAAGAPLTGHALTCPRLTGAGQRDMLLTGDSQRGSPLTGASHHSPRLAGAGQRDMLLTGESQRSSPLTGASHHSPLLAGAGTTRTAPDRS